MGINLFPREDDDSSVTRYHQPLRARGNLTYLEFIALVKMLWEEGHPDIPIVPNKGKNFAHYPCIVYGLEIRTPLQEERKPRYRGKFEHDDRTYIQHGQRFVNMVSFSVRTENEPELADEVIELFELFMMEWTPVFKELGASDFMYNRRLSDDEETRKGEDVIRRTVVYRLVTEILMQAPYDVIEAITIDVRRKLDAILEVDNSEPEAATPVVNIVDLYGQATPSI